MTARSIGAGIRGAARRPWLAALLWAWTFVLGFVAITPLWRWLRAAMALSPETDILRQRLSIGALGDLLTSNPDVMPTIVSLTAALVLVAFVSNAFIGGGVLAVVLEAADERPLLVRFLAGGGRFFGRFLRLLALFVLTTAIVGGAVAGVVGAWTKTMTENGWEPGGLVSLAILLASVGLVVGVFVLALDYARIRVAVTDAHGMVRAWLAGIGFVIRHPFATLTIGALSLAGLLVCLLASHQVATGLGAESAGVIALGLIVQEAILVIRSGVRVAQVAAEAHLFTELMPPPSATDTEKVSHEGAQASSAAGGEGEREATSEPVLEAHEVPAGAEPREATTFAGETKPEDM